MLSAPMRPVVSLLAESLVPPVEANTATISTDESNVNVRLAPTIVPINISFEIPNSRSSSFNYEAASTAKKSAINALSKHFM